MPSPIRGTLAALLLSSCVAPAEDPVVGSSNGVINGDVANGVYTGVARLTGVDCSAVLVAPRVMLTSAHCVSDYALQCTSVASEPLGVTFAEPAGGWVDAASYDTRTVPVQALVQRPEIFDLSQCAGGDSFHCGNPTRESIDHSRELVVLYLAEDAPPDAVPLPILVHGNTDTTHSAAEVAKVTGLTTWVGAETPLVTTVGYGIGSHAYTVGSAQVRGRDFGIQRWTGTLSAFAGFLGNSDCDSLRPSSNQPGVVVSPDDLSLSDVVDPTMVAPGESYWPSTQAHSGTGDSGGPILVGAGPSANGVSPDPLPTPVSGTYDPSRNYVAGTASLWVGSGEMLVSAFTPTWTFDASAFLMDALHDSDGDDYADPVDDDVDGDGCDNDVDQHPDDAYVRIGTTLHINCNPSSSAWYGYEGSHSDSDGVPDCQDDDDDGDGIADALDSCPADASQVCMTLGSVCPWTRIFFDCRIAGCLDLFVRLSRLVNPDPTRELAFRVLVPRAYRDNEVVIAPAEGMTVEESAAALTSGHRSETLLLDVEEADGTETAIAAYSPSSVRVTDLRGASALALRFSRDGRLLEIRGTTAH
jgi:hypothetical protein